jgi:hypothetical protein
MNCASDIGWEVAGAEIAKEKELGMNCTEDNKRNKGCPEAGGLAEERRNAANSNGTSEGQRERWSGSQALPPAFAFLRQPVRTRGAIQIVGSIRIAVTLVFFGGSGSAFPWALGVA